MTRGFRSSLCKPLLTHCRTSPFASRLALTALLLLPALFAIAPCAHAQSASTWNKRGQAAELKEDYDTAYEDYRQAHLKSPKDMRYTARLDAMRFKAAAQHVDRGRVLRSNGDIPGALNNFSRALEIDPSYEAARQEIEATERSEKIPGAMPIPPPGTASSSDLVNNIAKITGPTELKPISTDLITLNIPSMDTKSVYQAIGKLAGINVLFDEFTPKRIPVVLNGVSLSDALRIVGLISNTFYKVLTPDTIYVAENTRDKHTSLDEMALQTFYVTNATLPVDINEIATALRQVFPAPDQTFVVNAQDAIVMRAPPAHLMLAQKLLNDLDRTKAEVVVDVAILEVNRDKVRNLGVTLPQSFSITPQVTPNSTNTLSSATSSAAALASNFTLNTLANINATNFAVTIGGGTLSALLSDSDTRVLQNPSVRATDGSDAVLKVGTKVPIATGSYNAGTALGTAGLGGIGSQTQFQYQDVGVTIDITPQIHLDRQISLKLSVEDSTEAGQVTIQGVTEPIFGQRSIKDTIQLRDGEPCLLAGLLSKTDNSTTSGTPGLASLPLLKYIFGSVNKEVQQGEIVFILVPHIVRESVLTRLNTRPIDTGTQADIQVNRSESPAFDALFPANPDFAAAPTPNMTAAQGAEAMVPELAQQATRTPGVNAPVPGVIPGANAPRNLATATPPAPPVAAIPSAAVPSGVAPSQPLTFSITPANSTQAVNATFNVAIGASNAHDVFSVPLQLQFDPKVLQLVNVDTGGLLGSDGQPVALVHRDEGNGLVTVSASRPPGVAGVTAAQGQVCILQFRAIAPGDSNLTLVKVAARNSAGANLPASGSQAVVHVK
jgi:general secretion pathway protein D